MPRFVRELPDNGKEILCMKVVLQYLLESSKALIEESELDAMVNMTQYEWQSYADEIKVIPVCTIPVTVCMHSIILFVFLYVILKWRFC